MKNQCVLRQVNKSYQVNGENYPVLLDINLAFDLKGINVLLGQSGCGKTTLLRLLAQLERPDSGEIVFYGDDERMMSPKIGVVFQEPRLMPWLDVAGNIVIHQEKPDWALAEKLLDLMGLADFGKAYPAELSGGMASRVAIARALAYQPDLLLMDEPFAALDYFTRLAMEEEIVRIHQKYQMGIIFVTHDVSEALLIGQALFVLNKGAQPEQFHLEAGYPRNIDTPKMLALKEELLAKLKPSAF